MTEDLPRHIAFTVLAAVLIVAAAVVAVVHRGCPIGTLSSELSKNADAQARESGLILGTVLDFIEQQFREAGRRDARELAVAMRSAYEGVRLLANVLADTDLITTECRRGERWIDSLI